MKYMSVTTVWRKMFAGWFHLCAISLPFGKIWEFVFISFFLPEAVKEFLNFNIFCVFWGGVRESQILGSQKNSDFLAYQVVPSSTNRFGSVTISNLGFRGIHLQYVVGIGMEFDHSRKRAAPRNVCISDYLERGGKIPGGKYRACLECKWNGSALKTLFFW